MKVFARALLAAFVTLSSVAAAMAATLLPPGEIQFSDANGVPLASGTVQFYIPSTSTPKATWQDSGGAVLNTNPVVLDAAGRAIIYGVGSYRQVVKDVNGVTIWDQVTADTSAGSQVFGGTSGGTGNAQTLAAGTFTSTDGQVVIFRAGSTNSGAMTLTPSGGTPISVVRDTLTGPVALTGNEVIASNIIETVYDASGGTFHLVSSQVFAGYSASMTNLTVTTASTIAGTLAYTYPTTLPQGRLTPTTGVPVIVADASASASLFYTPYIGNLVPIYNGTTYAITPFSELTLSLANAAYTANSLFDVFAFSNAGVVTIASGPAWTTTGNYVRTTVLTTGTAARSAALSRVNGLLTNTGSMAARNGATTYTIAANQGTYLGTVWIDAAAQATTCQVSAGQNRTCGVWNMYNRAPMMMLEFDANSWSHTNNGVYQAANATLANSITVISGVAEEMVDVNYQVQAQGAVNSLITKVGIGAASATVLCGVQGFGNGQNAGTNTVLSLTAHCSQLPFIGAQAFIAIDFSSGSTSALTGGAGIMEMRAQWRG